MARSSRPQGSSLTERFNHPLREQCCMKILVSVKRVVD
ncbi:hypothetical protein PMI14_04708, partial [Acidovorax sp. CF316]